MKDRLEQLKAVRDPRRGEGTGDTPSQEKGGTAMGVPEIPAHGG